MRILVPPPNFVDIPVDEFSITTGKHKIEPIDVKYRSVAQFGRAFALGAKGRGFKSCHSDQFIFKKLDTCLTDLIYFSLNSITEVDMENTVDILTDEVIGNNGIQYDVTLVVKPGATYTDPQKDVDPELVLIEINNRYDPELDVWIDHPYNVVEEFFDDESQKLIDSLVEKETHHYV